ncbi:MAG: hypothetical protein IID35_11260, partial [Planctomycetes bacterium]|nr:hypothetical protein [Planctomycetota bacterium]
MSTSNCRRGAYAIVVATIFVGSPSTAHAQCDLQQSVELLTPSPTEAVGFGRSVAIDGDFLVVGAQNDPPAGAAYVYRFLGTGWTHQAKLTVPGLPDGARFGYSVDIDGNVILVGARNDDGAAPGSGAAYIFLRDGSQWIVEDKLVGLDPRMYDHFGAAVALDGDRALVGTTGDTGSADVYRRDGTNWVHEAALLPPFSIGETYGNAVALDGGFAVVGDHGNAFA